MASSRTCTPPPPTTHTPNTETPLRPKTAPSHPLSSSKATNLDVTNRAIQTELKGVMLEDVAGLPEAVFPSSSLPVDIEGALKHLSSETVGQYSSGLWTNLTRQALSNVVVAERDAHVCNQLNNIVEAVSNWNKFSGPPARQWTGHFATTPLDVTDHATVEACQRKPDGVLLPSGMDHAQARRRDAVAFLEFKTNQDGTGHGKSSKQLAENVRLAFGAQYDRRFILGMALIGSSLRLSLYDCAGLLQSVAIDIHENPQTFLRVLCGFAFGDRATLGFDPTVTEPDENGTRSITVRGTKYDIEKVMHMDNTLRGRGTIILQVRSGPESTSIIKDSWVDVSRPEKEHEILEKAKDVEGIVHMIDFERVEINGIVDSTKIIRDKLGVATKMVLLQYWQALRLHFRTGQMQTSTNSRPTGEHI
ncbi:hypothetical protein PUNSTDRAFT_44122 [Punctularia strigosozonata HHB-11173 SS5]|uniref:uncharacterized protein n=1 Tax=Punctularia strigosozonata (strain HHB-11173) TaxID=741275 RepID=UPI0004417740|nr:uncharacterized protein PUNSTDRAFT_44122 [Punctularia strigosozonata HHB-11173 SS5]EIN09894.1 hypothetical protein PUNSTDRAFT_44122 [Punctularia strigosozonata HHB-11173 SS5]